MWFWRHNNSWGLHCIQSTNLEVSNNTNCKYPRQAAFLEDNDTNFEEKQLILLTLSNSFKKISKQLQGFWIAAPKNGVTCCTIKKFKQITSQSFSPDPMRHHTTFKLVSIEKNFFDINSTVKDNFDSKDKEGCNYGIFGGKMFVEWNITSHLNWFQISKQTADWLKYFSMNP